MSRFEEYITLDDNSPPIILRQNGHYKVDDQDLSLRKIEIICEQLNVDITENYEDWINLAFALAELGENGRNYFLKISSYYPGYDPIEADIKFTNALKTRNDKVKIATFYQLIKDKTGIDVSEIHKQAWNELNQVKDVVRNNTNKLEPDEKEDSSPIIDIYTGAELFSMNTKNVPTLIGEIFPTSGVVALAGGSDTGKSMLLRQLTISLVQKESFLEWPINSRYAKAIFLSTEDDAINTSWLIRKQAKTPDKLENIRFLFNSEDAPKKLEKLITIAPVDLIIVDAFADVFPSDLKDTSQLRATINIYREIAIKYDCLIIFLHHTGKRTQKLVPNKDNILAGQGFEAKMRLVIELRNDVSNSDIKHLCIVKGNYLGKEYKNESFKLIFDSENFTFTNTGERVPFDQLAEITEDNGAVKVPLSKACEIDTATHLEVLNQIFENGYKPKLKDLQTRISNKYGEFMGTTFGGKRVDQYLDYLMNDLKVIAKEGKDRSPKTYYYLTTDHLTEYQKKGGD